MNEDVRDTVLREHMHRQRAELLASQYAVDVTRYMSGPINADQVAVLALLQRFRKQIYEQRARIELEINASDDEMFIELGRYELPLPDDWQSLRFMDMRLKIVANQFPPRVVYSSQNTDQGTECDDPTCDLLHHAGGHSASRQRRIDHDLTCPDCWARRCTALIKQGVDTVLVQWMRDAGPTVGQRQMRILERATPDQIAALNHAYTSMGR